MNAEQEGMSVSSSSLGKLIPPSGNIFAAPATRHLKQQAVIQALLIPVLDARVECNRYGS
jgi:hypothetical protein